jgi:3-hydroxyisobutyrate dehydrogenase
MIINEIGFIGLGVMGKSMAANLIKAGFTVTIYSHTQKNTAALLKAGATWKDSPQAMAKTASLIITMVGYPKDVEEIYCSEHGLLHAAKKGTYLIDMTTSSPVLAKKIFNESKKNGLHTLDAPVSGGDIGARDKKLTIMVGGEKAAFDTVIDVFSALGTTIRYFGSAGSGQYTKMCNQIAIASNMIGVCEAVIYAKKVGLDPIAVVDTISQGAAASWSLSNLAPRMLHDDYSPGFFVKHFIKDMRIALESAAEISLELPGLTLAKKLYDELAAKGSSEDGTQALLKWYELK